MSATARISIESLEASENEGYIRVMRSFDKRGESPAKLALKNYIYSFSNADAACHLSYEEIKERLGISAPTASAWIQAMEKSHEIERAYRDGTGTSYRYCSTEEVDGIYDVVPLAFFKAKGIVRNDIRLLARMYSMCKKKGNAEGSYAQFARWLGLSEETIRRSIKRLIRLKLIFRKKGNEGVHKKKVGVYHVGKAYSEFVKHCTKKERKPKKEAQEAPKNLPKSVRAQIDAANAKSEREGWYARRHAEVLAKRDSVLNVANSDIEFKNAEAELSKMEFEIAKAEMYAPMSLPALQERQRELRQIRAERLQAMNLSEFDLEAHWHCKKCEDSGFIKQGKFKDWACDCYKKLE